eukprot:1972739-Amphidinium_carterae.1
MQLKQWLGGEYHLYTLPPAGPSRLHALTQENWQSLLHFGFPCQTPMMAHAWSTSITLCADAWYRDLEDMVPDAKTDAGN